MDFDLTEEQIMTRNMARDFVEREVIPQEAENDIEQRIPVETLEKMKSLGFFGAPIPEKYGGMGIDHVTYGLLCEEFGRASASVFTTAFTVHTSLFQMTLLKWCNDAQKDKYLPQTTRGKLLGCFGLTEPNVGSNPAAMETSALKEGDNWVLNGNKMWISNGGIADLALVFAQADKAKAHRGIAAFLVERGWAGFSSQDIHGKMGLHASNTSELIFEDCRVPAENLIGDVGDGFKIAMYALDNARVSTAAACVGIAQACIDASVKYAQERRQFGKPIGSFQLIQQMIADMIVETEAARFLVYRAFYLTDKEVPHTKEAAMAKYYASENALRAAKSSIQVHGGYGYSNEYPVERYWRDAMGLTLYEGTSQIQELIIGRDSIGIRAFV